MPQIPDYPLITPVPGDTAFVRQSSTGKMRSFEPSETGFRIKDYLLLTWSGSQFSANTDLTVAWNGVAEATGAFVGVTPSSQIAIPVNGHYIITISTGAVGPVVDAWVEKNNALVTGSAQFGGLSVGGTGARGHSVSGAPLALTTSDVIEGHYAFTGSGSGIISSTVKNWISLYRISD
jgi:hypothetical protein